MKTLTTLKASCLFAGLVLGASQFAQAQIQDWSELFEKNKPTVVSITITGEKKANIMQNPFPQGSPFEFFFDQQQAQRPRQIAGSGSGFILEQDGYIVTNAHVVQDADVITVHLSDRRELKAKLIGTDEKSDVAILKIDTKNLPTVKIGNSEILKVGQPVLAVGSPFGLDYTATQGIISSLGRNLPSDNYTPFIQTDAAVNPGNSGGPLFNVNGEVIGINSQIYSRTGSYAGVSFAIPIDLVMDVAKQLRENGKVSRGWLGVTIQEITPELADSYKMERPHGALISDVLKDSPAEKAKLKVGDVITKFNGKEIQESSALPANVGRIAAGSTAKLTVLRDNKTIEIDVKIEALPDDLDSISSNGTTSNNKLGIEVAELPANISNIEGVIIRNVNKGPAQKAGINKDDIIREINGLPVRNLKDFNEIIAQAKDNNVLRILLQRQNRAIFVAIRLN